MCICSYKSHHSPSKSKGVNGNRSLHSAPQSSIDRGGKRLWLQEMLLLMHPQKSQRGGGGGAKLMPLGRGGTWEGRGLVRSWRIDFGTSESSYKEKGEGRGAPNCSEQANGCRRKKLNCKMAPYL